MPKNLDLTDNLEEYIIDHSENLTKVQKEILDYNDIFVELQIKTIREIISNIGIDDDNKPTKKQIKNASEWCLKYKLPINENCIYRA